MGQTSWCRASQAGELPSVRSNDFSLRITKSGLPPVDFVILFFLSQSNFRFPAFGISKNGVIKRYESVCYNLRMSDEDFEKLLGEALDSLPEEFAEKLENVGVTFENWPSPRQMAKLGLGRGSLLFGLYEGIPLTKRANYTGVLPDKITIFKYPILMVSRNEEDVRRRVRRTIMHEIGHHFGLSDQDMR